jgi:lipoprotein-releasing system permease protein
MRYAAKIAFRHFLSSPGQAVLLISGVALGVTVFIFMSALIGGLATLLTQRTGRHRRFATDTRQRLSDARPGHRPGWRHRGHA